MKRICLYLCFLLLLLACKENARHEDPLLPGHFKLIGHKGSGPYESYGNRLFLENSFPGVLNAMNKLDGSEIDLQLSRDTTLWVFHDNEIECADHRYKNISDVRDDELNKISRDRFNGELLSFDSLLYLLEKADVKDKILCLDLKVLQNESAINMFGNDIRLATFVGQQLAAKRALVKNLRVILEIPKAKQCAELAKLTDFETYWVTDGQNIRQSDLEKGINLSFSINDKIHPLLKQVKTDKSVWVANSFADFKKASSCHPTIIQTDHIDFGHFLIKNRLKESNWSGISQHTSIQTKDEFYELYSLPVTSKIAKFCRIRINDNQNPDSVLLVLSAVNQKQEVIFWNSFLLLERNEHFDQFIDLDFLKRNGCRELHFYLWNRKKTNMNIQKIELFVNS